MDLGKLHVYCHHLSKMLCVLFCLPFTNAPLELKLSRCGELVPWFTVGSLCLEQCLAHGHRGDSLGERVKEAEDVEL